MFFMETSPDITNPCYDEHILALRYIGVPVYKRLFVLFGCSFFPGYLSHFPATSKVSDGPTKDIQYVSFLEDCSVRCKGL